jgi:hypothetical protein
MMSPGPGGYRVGFPKVKLRDWGQLREFVGDGYLYRGQRDARWGLTTSLERFCVRWELRGEKCRDAERNGCREFRRAYHQYGLHVPSKDSRLEWLALMQHHGSPTRLLDFTYSIYVAAYFALEYADRETPAAVWRVNGGWAMNGSIALLKRAEYRRADSLRWPYDERDDEVCNDTLLSSPGVPCACPQTPFRLNERLRVQMGVFMVPGRVDRTFEENLRALPGHTKRQNVLQVVIPPAVGGRALHELFDMGVSRRTLFPGLDGYAQSLAVYSPAVNRPRKWD